MLGSADIYLPPSSVFDLGTFARDIHSESPLRAGTAQYAFEEHVALNKRRAALEDDARRARVAARKKRTKQREKNQRKKRKRQEDHVIDLTTSLERAGATLASVPTIPVIDLTKDDEDEEECSICYGNLPSLRSAECQTLACNHSFCTSCIGQWVQVNPSCPTCRKPIK